MNTTSQTVGLPPNPPKEGAGSLAAKKALLQDPVFGSPFEFELDQGNISGLSGGSYRELSALEQIVPFSATGGFSFSPETPIKTESNQVEKFEPAWTTFIKPLTSLENITGSVFGQVSKELPTAKDAVGDLLGEVIGLNNQPKLTPEEQEKKAKEALNRKQALETIAREMSRINQQTQEQGLKEIFRNTGKTKIDSADLELLNLNTSMDTQEMNKHAGHYSTDLAQVMEQREKDAEQARKSQSLTTTRGKRPDLSQNKIAEGGILSATGGAGVG